MVYAGKGPFGPAERLERAMAESKTAFRSEPIGAEPSAFHDLWNGLLAPDPFLVLVTEGDVQIGKPYAVDPALLADVESLLGSIDDPSMQDEEFCDAIRALVARDPQMPVLHERLAGCLQQIGKKAEAIAALEGEIAVNPSHPGVNFSLAVVDAAAGKIDQARDHAATALLYYPAFPAARKWLSEGGIPGTDPRAESFAPRVRLDIDEAGFVVVKSPEGQPWVGAWATCKAGFRWAPEVRMAFGMSAGAYKPSLLEEMVCLRVAADAYEAGRAGGGPAEAIGDVLAGATGSRRLLEAAFFEVIGWHDPDMMKLLPPEFREMVMAWIDETVLRTSHGTATSSQP